VAAAVLFNFLSLGIDAKPSGDMLVFGKDIIPLLALSGAVGFISLVNIFLFAKRKVQIALCRLNLFLVAALIGLSVYFLFGNPSGTIETPGIGLVMPLFMFVFNLLAMKKIDDDEKLVRSMDRLR
jgi:hypothetical protein